MMTKMKDLIIKLDKTKQYLLNDKKKLEIENLKGSTEEEVKSQNKEDISNVDKTIANLEIMKSMINACIKTNDEVAAKTIYKNIKSMLTEIADIVQKQ